MLVVTRSILTFVTLLACGGTAVANNNNSTAVTSVTTVQKPKTPGNIFSGFASATRSTNLVDYQNGEREDAMAYSLKFNAALGNYTASVQGGYSQNLDYPEKDDFANTSLGLIRTPFKINRPLALGYRVGATLPTSKDSKIRQNLQTSLAGAINLSVNPEVLRPGWSLSGSVGAARNFHEFETAVDGKVNTAYSSSQSFSVGYTFTNRIGLSAAFLHRNTWSYQNAMRDAFELSQEISYQINNSFAVAAGHTNEGASLKANASDSNVEFINDQTSSVYASLTYIY